MALVSRGPTIFVGPREATQTRAYVAALCMAGELAMSTSDSDSESEWQEVEPSAREGKVLCSSPLRYLVSCLCLTAALLGDLPLAQAPRSVPASTTSSQSLEIVISRDQHGKRRYWLEVVNCWK